MKLKFIAAACATLCASGAFAALTCPTWDATNPHATVNNCTVGASMFVVGSSALGGALGTVVAADLFDTTTMPVIKVLNPLGPQGSNVSAWYGMSKSGVTGGTSKRLFVVYNKNNGSAAGVTQMLADGTKVAAPAPEADVVTVGPVKTTAGSCTTDVTSTAAAPVVTCTTHGLTKATLALSDVPAAELYKFSTWATKLNALTTIKETVIGMQGFGIGVSASLYSALQTAQGINSGTCSGDACVPSIRSVDYASLVSGKKTTAAALFGVPDGVLTLARRDDQSGTQATSNMFFLNGQCGHALDAKGKAIKGVLGGEVTPIPAAPVNGNSGTYCYDAAGAQLAAAAGTDADCSGHATTTLMVKTEAVGGNVKTKLTGSGYVIGALTLQEPQGSTWKFVRIDGNLPFTSADSAKQRDQSANGNYPMVVNSVAVEYAKADTKTDRDSLNTAVIAGLKDSTLHNLMGIAYLDGGVSGQQSKVVRAISGNDCSSLILK